MVCMEKRRLREMVSITQTKCEIQTKAQCLHILSMYLDYKKKRLINDSCAVQELLKIRIKYVFKALILVLENMAKRLQ